MNKSLLLQASDRIRKKETSTILGQPVMHFLVDTIRREAFPGTISQIDDLSFDVLRARAADFSVPLPVDKIDVYGIMQEKMRQLRNNKNWNFLPVILAWIWEIDRATALFIFERCKVDYLEMLLEESAEKGGKAAECSNIFISWTGEYAREIASAIKAFLQSHAHQVRVFLSSGDFQRGRWEERLRASLIGATDGLVIATQDILDSQFSPYEFALLSEKSIDPLVLLFDCPRAVLPAVMQSHHLATFSEERLREWVANVLPKDESFPARAFLRLVKKIERIRNFHGPAYVTDDESRWRGELCRPLAMASQQNSAFDLEEIIKLARRRLILVAQNHWHMTDKNLGHQARYWSLIKAALVRRVSVDIVAMKQGAAPPGGITGEVSDPIDVWAIYMEKRAYFPQQTNTAWETFQEWNVEYRDSLQKTDDARLSFHAVYFAPVTMSFVDPDEQNGLLVMSPRPASRESGDRPQFIIRKQHEPRIFDYYWMTVKDSMTNGGWSHRPFGLNENA